MLKKALLAASAIAIGAAAATTATQTPVVPGTIAVVGISTPTATGTTTTVTPTPTTVNEDADATSKTPLKPLDLSDMRLWNWNGKWTASEWDHAWSATPWRYNRVAKQANGDTNFTMDNAAAPQLQAQGGTPAYKDGLWETEVTLPKLRSGMVAAPLWIYDPATKDEVDFEFAGIKGLDVTMHAYVKGAHKSETVRLFPGVDFSGKRVRFGIKVNQTTGIVKMFVNGEMVHSWKRAKMTFFVANAMKPWIHMWPANKPTADFSGWLGKWTPMATGESAKMVVHGYGYKALK